MRYFLSLMFFLALTARGQETNAFLAYGSEINLIEGGRRPIVVMEWDDQRFTMQCPVGFASHLDSAARAIRFEAMSGAAAINITMTTNYPGELPEADDLKALALARHPGATFLQCAPFPTSSRPGLCVDLTQSPTPEVRLRTRHGFVPTAKGLVEFVFSADDADYDKLRVGCMQAMGTFTVETIKPRVEANSQLPSPAQ